MNDYWLKKAKANQKDRDKIEKATLAKLQTITNETSAAFHKALSDYKEDFGVTDLGVNPNEKVTPKELRLFERSTRNCCRKQRLNKRPWNLLVWLPYRRQHKRKS